MISFTPDSPQKSPDIPSKAGMLNLHDAAMTHLSDRDKEQINLRGTALA